MFSVIEMDALRKNAEFKEAKGRKAQELRILLFLALCGGIFLVINNEVDLLDLKNWKYAFGKHPGLKQTDRSRININN